jgi:GNAT superfamily N-acetyltransferase
MLINLSDCKQIRLSMDTRIKAFDCGDPDLNDFLFNDAIDYLKELYAVTYLYEYGDDTVAFFSVSNDKISYDETSISKTEWNRFCRSIPNEKRRTDNPAVKIGRFGVNARYQKSGIGTQLFDYIKMFFIDNNKTGCRYITLDAYNNSATITFYQKNGFVFLTENDKLEKTRSMYFDLRRFMNTALRVIASGQ